MTAALIPIAASVAGSFVASKLMGKGKAPGVDTAAIQKQKDLIASQENSLNLQEKNQADQDALRKKKELAANNARRGRAGGGSLLSGLETGVTPTAEKRATLG